MAHLQWNTFQKDEITMADPRAVPGTCAFYLPVQIFCCLVLALPSGKSWIRHWISQLSLCGFEWSFTVADPGFLTEAPLPRAVYQSINLPKNFMKMKEF